MFQYPQYFPLPPNVTTQFPTRDSIANDKIVPVPIESSFFIEDARKDSSRMNRYYFDFPAEWATANNGESIVGIRSIWLVAKHRKLDFAIYVLKVDKLAYKNLYKTEFNKTRLTINEAQKLVSEGICKYIGVRVIDWLYVNDDIRLFFDAVHKAYKERIKDEKNDWFTQPDDHIAWRDIQIDGYYDNDGYHEVIYCENNKIDKNETFTDTDGIVKYKIPYVTFFHIEEENDDFKELLNVGEDRDENSPNIYNEYVTEIVFDNVWDRHSCKVYSSIAEQSLHHYIGNSEVNFVPIKYYKLQSSDQRFWIEFHSGRHYNVPIKLPRNASFVINMQFLPYNKLLYV